MKRFMVCLTQASVLFALSAGAVQANDAFSATDLQAELSELETSLSLKDCMKTREDVSSKVSCYAPLLHFCIERDVMLSIEECSELTLLWWEQKAENLMLKEPEVFAQAWHNARVRCRDENSAHCRVLKLSRTVVHFDLILMMQDE